MKIYNRRIVALFLAIAVISILLICQNASCESKPKPAEKASVYSGKRPSSVPAGVDWYRDVEFAAIGNHRLLLDLYIPQKGDGPWPLIVWIHGGGWISGGKFPAPGAWLSSHGYAVASISYRLSEKAAFPAQIHDCKAAVRWLRANAGLYNLNPEKIGALGESAGGHLAALLGVSGNDKKLEGKVGGYLDQSSSVAAVCDCFGPVDITPDSESDLKTLGLDAQVSSTYLVKKLLGGALATESKARQASAKTYISSDDPPFLIVHGSEDPIVPVMQSKRFHKQLKSAGVSSELLILKGGGHVFFGNRAARVKIQQFFDGVLK